MDEMIEVDFKTMLKADGEIICGHWLFNNSKVKCGIDFTKPMMFNKFIELLGTHYTSFNCKGLFENAKWWIYPQL